MRGLYACGRSACRAGALDCRAEFLQHTVRADHVLAAGGRVSKFHVADLLAEVCLGGQREESGGAAVSLFKRCCSRVWGEGRQMRAMVLCSGMHVLPLKEVVRK